MPADSTRVEARWSKTELIRRRIVAAGNGEPQSMRQRERFPFRNRKRYRDFSCLLYSIVPSLFSSNLLLNVLLFSHSIRTVFYRRDSGSPRQKKNQTTEACMSGRNGIRWYCSSRDCNWSFVGTVSGENAEAPRCVCGRPMKCGETIPAFHYLDFLREDVQKEELRTESE
jgi:hypothetical protein